MKSIQGTRTGYLSKITYKLSTQFSVSYYLHLLLSHSRYCHFRSVSYEKWKAFLRGDRPILKRKKKHRSRHFPPLQGKTKEVNNVSSKAWRIERVFRPQSPPEKIGASSLLVCPAVGATSDAGGGMAEMFTKPQTIRWSYLSLSFGQTRRQIPLIIFSRYRLARI